MDFRTFVSFAVVSLIAVSTAFLVLGRSDPPPPCEGNGMRGEPSWVLCPTPNQGLCDQDDSLWQKTGEEWLILDGGEYRLSYEGETVPKFPGSLSVNTSSKKTIIAKT